MSINGPSLMASWCVVQKIYSKRHLVSCTNTYRDATDLVNHGMVKNTETWISWERKIIFLRNKKNLNLCFRWHILRSDRLVAEVTFKSFLFDKKNPVETHEIHLFFSWKRWMPTEIIRLELSVKLWVYPNIEI